MGWCWGHTTKNCGKCPKGSVKICGKPWYSKRFNNWPGSGILQSAQWQILWTIPNIDHRVASPYHPQTGGHTERYNRTLCGMLAKYVNDEQSDWDEKINSMLFAYRTSIHSSTKETPFYLVYGRQPRLPVDLALPTGPVESLPEDFEELIEQRCQSFLRP